MGAGLRAGLRAGVVGTPDSQAFSAVEEEREFSNWVGRAPSPSSIHACL